MIRILFCLLILTSCATINQHNIHNQNENIYGSILKENVIWKDTIVIERDILIPEGVVVKVEPGTKILVNRAETTRTEPIFLQPETEILIRGRLIAKGLEDKPISFISSEKEKTQKDWGGLVLDGGTIELSNVVVKHASTAITLINGDINMSDTLIEDNNYGVVLFENVKGFIQNFTIRNNKSAMIVNNEGVEIKNVKIQRNEDGLIIKNINQKTTGFKISENETGIIIPFKLLNFFIRDNSIYENKNNAFFYPIDNFISQ